jgi:hypothetical protein
MTLFFSEKEMFAMPYKSQLIQFYIVLPCINTKNKSLKTEHYIFTYNTCEL